MNTFASIISQSLSLNERAVENTLQLLDENCTIPFISRYRKERICGMDEVQVTAIAEMREKLADVAKRKDTIISTIENAGKMTPQLRKCIEQCWTMSELEDIYMPYKPKRRTKAETARQNGLEPLANAIMLQREAYPMQLARKYIKGDVKTVDDAISGAKYIIAEAMSENEHVRKSVRGVFARTAVITSKVIKAKAEEKGAQKYSDYFDFSESLRRCSSHRLLAMRRGEADGFLRVSIKADDEECRSRIKRQYVRSANECGHIMTAAADDAFKRLVCPSMETEFAALSKQKADESAINVFAANLRQLLLAAPLGQCRVMGIDPGFRTGCKVVCLDGQGKLLHFEAIYPNAPRNDAKGAARQVMSMVGKYGIEAMAVGNGTASRETVAFLKGLGLADSVRIFVVSEDGASVYSASDVAREEFPNEDVTVRGAVSIGRRLMDPLAELVKIDPKSIGVGQYQHDVDQTALKKKLDMVVESCVNTVGVNLNTASRHLLMYVSGLNQTTAASIVAYRNANGPFGSRAELMKVPHLGAKTFTQCAGFLRIPGAANPLDNSAVHPESYDIVRRMAKDCKCTVIELMGNKSLQELIDINRYVSDGVGLPTLRDIMEELKRPGRDPRSEVETFEFDSTVHEISDLKTGMLLPGIVTNITDFGAFVDVGVHTDGLVHVSQLADSFVKDPSDVVKLHQHVVVRVTGVDLERGRISLSMRK